MTTKKLGTIDLETGEILEGIPVYVKAKVKWSEGWFMEYKKRF